MQVALHVVDEIGHFFAKKIFLRIAKHRLLGTRMSSFPRFFSVFPHILPVLPR